MKKTLLLILAFATLSMTACEEPNVPNEPNDNPNNVEQEDPKPEPKPLPEATYEFKHGITATAFTLTTNGLRNDYISFYEESTSRTLFIDFYAPIDSPHLPSGEYPLGDGSVMTCAAEYTYLTLYVNGDLLRFSEGGATVEVDAEHESGFPWYHITAYFTMPNGETVSLDYEGQIAQE